MNNFILFPISQHEGNVDGKGRFILPAGLKKRFQEEELRRLTIKKGYEGCLEMYTREMWKPIAQKVSKLNDFNKNEREFKRLFFDGAVEVELDSISRVLIPKWLISFASIEKEIYVKCLGNKIEIWSKQIYENLYGDKSASNDYMSDLSNQVLGQQENQNQ